MEFRSGLIERNEIAMPTFTKTVYKCGPGLKRFINHGGFGKIAKRENRKKISSETKTWLPVGASIAAVVIATCSWLFPRTDNVIIQKLQSQINDLKNENKDIKDSLNKVIKSKEVVVYERIPHR